MEYKLLASGGIDLCVSDRFMLCVGVSCIKVITDETPMSGPIADASYESCFLDAHRKYPGSDILTCHHCGTRHHYFCDAIKEVKFENIFICSACVKKTK